MGEESVREQTPSFVLRCGQCGELTVKDTCCKFCSGFGTIEMIADRGTPLFYYYITHKKFSPLMVFECDGFEPVEFTFKREWVADTMKVVETNKSELDNGGDEETDKNKKKKQKGKKGKGLSEKEPTAETSSTLEIDLSGSSSFREYCHDFDDFVGVRGLGYKFKVVDLDSSPPTGVYVTNIGRSITAEDLEFEFSKGGTVLDVKVDRSEKNFAYAFVSMLDKEMLLKLCKNLMVSMVGSSKNPRAPKRKGAWEVRLMKPCSPFPQLRLKRKWGL